MARFIDDGETPVAYDSILVAPNKLSIFGSELSLKVVRELAKKPGCAMDLARKLEQHEQKIYYHLRNLENAGIIKQLRTEQRYGMTAKIYDVVSPVVATKLYNDGYEIKDEARPKDPKILKFLYPFVKDGKLNAKIIIGNPYPHGEHEKGAYDGPYVTDFALFLGNFIKELKLPCYKLDTQVRKDDLNDNLIIIGNPKTNVVANKLNSELPLYFDKEKEWSVVSKETGKIYTDDTIGVIVKCTSPFNKRKKILMLAGKRSRGTISAIIAFTQNTNRLINDEKSNRSYWIARGTDKDGDDFIDHVHFIE
jgi:DNA-binding transcriptional ArsR family regulator